MSKQKCTTHNWITSSRRGRVEECSVCDAQFPCKGNCGHVDCAIEKARKCHVCDKRIPNTFPGNFYLVLGNGTCCFLVHRDCVDKPDYVVCVK